MLAAVHPNSAVRHCTAKTALPCEQTTRHGKDLAHGKGASKRTTKNHARQRHLRTHDKDTLHGKVGSQRTTKKTTTTKTHDVAVHQNYAVRHDVLHGKGSFAMRTTLCRAQNSFFIFF
jgi:hypothetical protein